MDKKMSYEKWFKNCILILAGMLVLIAGIMILFDPFFHYHRPIVKYRLTQNRYINDGISRNFDFDGVIIGTSMSQNFKTSQMDALFGTKSVKLPYEGAGYEEISVCLDRTLSRNPGVKKVLWAMDYNGLLRVPDWSQYSGYPTYLYDDNPLNDAAYLFNKSIIYHALIPDLLMTVKGEDSMSMDDYSAWEAPTGAVQVYDGEIKTEKGTVIPITDAQRKNVTDTINDNFVKIAKKYPDTVFYVYLTPYSMYNWYRMWGDGTMNQYLEAQKIATELMLECPNIKFYTFFEHSEIIENLDYYRDEAHYCAEINEQILDWIAQDEGLVTKDNFSERFDSQVEYYKNFDYKKWGRKVEKEWIRVIYKDE